MFELLTEVSPSFCPAVKLYKWKSQRTGLQAVLIKRHSPSVQGYFAVASESNDDSGCPHTLEHIVFMGSKKYPYKGLLDTLSATQMASTNAWTGQDQTIYTLSSAGHEGFLNLLPVYLDHIINATVKEAACLTEVYHVDGKGEERGVVFSEMQSYEHTSDSLMTVKAQKMLYNDNSGYATNTGGSLKALRQLQPSTIKKYHERIYRPSNLSVIIAGDLEPEEMIETLTKYDNELPEEAQQLRPFVGSDLSTAESPLKKTETQTVEFPDASEDSGEVLVSWLGPHISDQIANTALQVVNTYLWTTDSGKLEHQFINVPEKQALASEVYGFTNEYLRTQISVSFAGVPVPKLEKASSALVNYLEVKLLEELDLSFLEQCIDTTLDGFVLAAEESINTFVDLAISDFLYGEGDSFEKWLGRADEFDALRKWTEKDWRAFIDQYYVKPAKACVLGKPSRDLHVKIDEEKKQHLNLIKTTKDLEIEEKRLQSAISENDREIPDELLNMLSPPDVSRIRFIGSKTGATTRLTEEGLPRSSVKIDDSIQALLEGEKDCKFALNFESTPSQFVSIKLQISTQHVDKELLPLISVVLGNAFMSPMKLDDGRVLSAEEVAQESQKDLLQANLNVDYQIREFVSISVKAKAKNYARAIEWIKRCIFNVIFDAEHTSIFIARYLKNIPEAKRYDQQLLQSSIDEFLLTDRSLRRQTDILVSESLVREYENDIEKTVESLKKLSNQLFQTRNIRGLIYGNIPLIASLTGPIIKPWIDLQKRFDDEPECGAKMSPIIFPNHYLSELGSRPRKEAILTLCASSDATHVSVVAKGPQKYGHPDLPVLTVVNTFLDMTEGPFWKAVRGNGYAYGASMSTSVQLGQMLLSIYSASDGLNAFKACKSVIQGLGDGTIPVERDYLVNVIATIVGDLASQLAEPASAIEEKFADTVVKGYEPNYVHKIISEIQKVTVDDFTDAIRNYYLHLFDPESSVVFAVAPPAEGEALQQGLEKMGYEVNLREIDDSESTDYSGSSGSDEDSSGDDSSDEESNEDSASEDEDD